MFSMTLSPSLSTVCASWWSYFHTLLPVGKVPTESRGDEAPIIHSV
jgi:hypothetical protein